LGQLQGFLQERRIEASELTPGDSMRLMIEWYRITRAGEASTPADALVFRYGGWSEGCATAFNVSLLRRVKALGGDTDLVAGITLMFDPGSAPGVQAHLSSTADGTSLEDFAQLVQQSTVFKLLGNRKPMAVVVESGAFR
jgi:hypothetical protein